MSIQDIFKGKVIIVGVGNILCGDDGFGPFLVDRLKEKIAAQCIDAGTAPENYLGKIIKERPDTIIIADVVHMALKPGEYRLLAKEAIIKSGFTTHDLSPVMFIEHLERETNADIFMLAVQPEQVDFGKEISESVKKTLEELVQVLGTRFTVATVGTGSLW